MEFLFIVFFYGLYMVVFLFLRRIYYKGHKWAKIPIVLSIGALGIPLGMLQSGKIDPNWINIIVCFSFPFFIFFMINRMREDW